MFPWLNWVIFCPDTPQVPIPTRPSAFSGVLKIDFLTKPFLPNALLLKFFHLLFSLSRCFSSS